MGERLQELTQIMLAAAQRAGADAADAMAVDGLSLHIDVRSGTLEQAERSEGIEIGLRVFLGRRQAVVSASDTKAETIAAMAERAIAMAREAPEDPYVGLADASQLTTTRDASGLDLADPGPEPDPAFLMNAAREAEAATLAVNGVSKAQGASAGWSRTGVWLAATNGFSGGYSRTGASISCTAIAGEGLGMERDYDGDARIYAADLRAPQEIGRTAGLRAVERLSARKPPTGHYPVLFDERISSSLIGHLLAAANGASIARGSSWLLGKIGADVLPATLSLMEDPHRARVFGSRPFDAEGLPTHPRAIIENGRLTGWTTDLASARKLGLDSSANAARGVSAAPSPSNWNVALTQGTASRADLLKDMGTGLLVTSMIGATISPTTGDYSRGASGFWVENGVITYPVNECTIAGNLPEMLLSLIPANDARLHLSRPVPSLLVEGMTLAGA